jgi:Zn-dependent protease with chaperone function
MTLRAPENQECETRTTDRRGWRIRLPDKPPVLEDARLLEYRHPAERRLLGLALATIAVLVAGAVWFRETDVLLAVGAIYLSMLFASMQAPTLNTMRGAEVTPTQFPAIHQIFEELRERFQAPPARVFVVRERSFSAQPMGIVAPYVIVLPHALLDALETEELSYVLGAALGHIRFGHTRMACLLGGQESQLPAPLAWIAWVRDLIFAGYWRAQVMTGDRAGILACADIEKAIRVRIKLSVGTNQSREVNEDDLIAQARRLSEGMSRFQAILIRWQSPTPPLIPRLAAMVEWAGMPPRPRV